MVAEAEVFPVYGDEYRAEEMSQWCAAVAYERQLTSGTDLHGITSLAAQRCIMCDD